MAGQGSVDMLAWAAHKQQIYKAASNNPTSITRHPLALGFCKDKVLSKSV